MKESCLPSPDIRLQLRRAAIGVLATLALAFLLVFANRLRAEHALAGETLALAAQRPSVDVAEVHDSGSSSQMILPGETAAWYESTIYARVSGYVAHWFVDIGDPVTAGETLATIETPELDAQLAAAQAKLQVAQAQIRVNAAAAEFAHTTYVRWRDSPKGVVSDQERENKKAEDAAAVAQLQAARAQVRLDQAEVTGLLALTRFKKVSAPYAGTITQRQIDIGDLVTAGSSNSTTPLFRMTQQDPMRVMVDVPQNLSGDLMKVGVPAQIFTTAAGSAALQGAVTRTSEAIDPKTRTFRTEIDVQNHDGRLVPGEYVKVGFALSNAGLHRVPAAALVFRSGGEQVAAVTAQGQVQFRPVTIARDDGDTVELSSGVSAGDRLVLNLSSRITDGEQVRE
jgi:RND family efflux transporter MFP subunit